VLSGAAGVGKTRLAREAVAACGPRKVRRRWIVGTASAQSVPLGAFADISSSFGPDPLHRVREAIDGLVGGLDDSPVIVGVDDAHLLDDLSAFAVHQLVTRRLATVILTIRSGEPSPDAITAMWKDHNLTRLDLQPLSLAESTRLVEHVLDGPVHSRCARRLWQYTQGNVLYLRHLIDSEVNAGRIARPSDMWLWEGQPELSPTLAELVHARLARAPRPVRDVLDALAVTEPLDTDVLTAITDADALAEAEILGLIRVDSDVQPTAVRLAHPMFGEVRRTGSLRLRQLSGRIATELARRNQTDPRNLVRRAVLTVESDLTPDPELFLAAASAATQLMDQRLAETLAERAVAAGGGPEARMVHAMAVTWQERGIAAETLLAELAAEASGPARVQIAILRAMNFAVVLGQVACAERELELLPAGDPAAQAIATALRAVIELVRGHSRTAVDIALTARTGTPASGIAQMLLAWALVTGLGDIGRIDEIEGAANVGYAVAEGSAEASHLRHPLGFQQTHGYRLAGALAQSDAVIARMRRDTLDVPFEQSWHSVLVGMSAMSRGALDDARRSLRESLAYLGTGDSGRMVKSFGGAWLTTVTAMAGRADEARREFNAIEWWARDPDACNFDSERSIAEAWTCAAEGSVSQAISIARDAAARESELDRPAWEVVLLQTATQFGDRTTAPKLAELAGQVQGPRAPSAAAHAAALAGGNGDGLLAASHCYEEFGDRLAAADTAAQAAVAYHKAGRRGSALIASATARRLATLCGGADTPALRTATAPLPITPRQREIISLAAQGLSNKQIADRLTMSIRSIEGHLFRASQRAGANSRDQLIAILRGS
jgi:DNA-binding CsgD family transcriptional regulator